MFLLTVCTQGELSYNGHEVRVFDFLTQISTRYSAQKNAPAEFGLDGHGGADYHLIDAFISAVAVSYSVYYHFFCQCLVTCVEFVFVYCDTL